MEAVDIDTAIAELESTVRGGVTDSAAAAGADGKPAEKPAEREAPKPDENLKAEIQQVRDQQAQTGRLVDAMQTLVYGLTKRQEERQRERPDSPPPRNEPQITMADLEAGFEKNPFGTVLWMLQQVEARSAAEIERRLSESQDPGALRKHLDPVLREYMAPLVGSFFEGRQRNALEEWAERNPEAAHARPVIQKILKEYPEIADRPDAVDVAYRLAKGSGLLESAPAANRFIGRSGGGGGASAVDLLSQEERDTARRYGISEDEYARWKRGRAEEAGG